MCVPAKLLDARGLVCPEPVRLAQLKLRDLPPGGELVVLVTDPAAPIDFEAWCEAGRNVFLGSETDNGTWRIRVRRSSC